MAIIDAEQITLYVSELRAKGVDALDALMKYAKENDIEPEVIGDIVRQHHPLMFLVTLDAENMHLVERSERLEFAY